MASPVQSNTTCDIYRSGNTPPAAPDVAGVAIHLTGQFGIGLESGEAAAELPIKFTHTALLDAAVNIRDDYEITTPATTTSDAIYVPDKNGTKFTVVFVELKGTGASYHKKVYLCRNLPTWPTTEL